MNAFGNKYFRRGAQWRAHIDEKTARLRARSLSIKEKDFYRSSPYIHGEPCRDVLVFVGEDNSTWQYGEL